MRYQALTLLVQGGGWRWLMATALTVSVISGSSAATQGEWGRTSSATARITLHIPARSSTGNQSEIRHRNGFEALSHFCQRQNASAQTPQGNNLYQFSLLSQSGSGELQTVLNDLCRGEGTAAAVSTQSQTTLLVAPL